MQVNIHSAFSASLQLAHYSPTHPTPANHFYWLVWYKLLIASQVSEITEAYFAVSKSVSL